MTDDTEYQRWLISRDRKDKAASAAAAIGDLRSGKTWDVELVLAQCEAAIRAHSGTVAVKP